MIHSLFYFLDKACLNTIHKKVKRKQTKNYRVQEKKRKESASGLFAKSFHHCLMFLIVKL